MRLIFWAAIAVVLIAVVAGLTYVRLAPSDPERWHRPVTADTDADMQIGAIRVRDADESSLSRLDQIAMSSPRTTRLAGSVEDGRITYVTRTKWIGFPDYTTAEVADGKLKLHARARFGKSDLGVNRARVERWLAQL